MERIGLITALYEEGQITSKSIVQAYYNVITSVVRKNNINTIMEEQLLNLLHKEFKIKIPAGFVRYVLALNNNGEIQYKARNYNFSFNENSIRNNNFNNKLDEIAELYKKYSNKHKKYINVVGIELRKIVIDNIDKLLDYDKFETSDDIKIWTRFLLELKETKEELYDFVATIRFSMVYSDLLFYNNVQKNYDKLCIYIDTPIVLALLSFADKGRIETAEYFVNKLVEKKCNIKIFDSTIQEVELLIKNAMQYAFSSKYDISKANDVCKNMHDTKTFYETEGICLSLKDKIKEKGIDINEKDDDDYILIDNNKQKYYEAVEKICNMIKAVYSKKAYSNEPDFQEESIMIDAENMNKIYIERKGKKASNIDDCKCVMVTTNTSLFLVAKKYNSNGIPAFVTLDYMVSLLFIDDSRMVEEYRSLELTEVCYNIAKPSYEICKKFDEIVEKHYQNNEYDDKKYYTLKNSALTDPILMKNIDNIDMITDETPSEVYQEIMNKMESDKKRADIEISKLNSENQELQKKYENDAEKYSKIVKSYDDKLKNIEEQTKINDEKERKKRDKEIKFLSYLSNFVIIIPLVIISGLEIVIINKYFPFDIIKIFGCVFVIFILENVIIKIIWYKCIMNFFAKKLGIDLDE